MDEYRALYRKYRPQAPAEVLGQEHVVRALAGAIRDGRLAHAFLFSGPRGTGKTSTARILAKMVNCENGPTAEPCGKCEQCLRIRDGSHLDVYEIDAASHGGVDDARELRERAPTAPAQGREKVYIIDEAQRLSREAFDALLKLVEEPPPGVRFVLATTEPHKVPNTIASRCQHYEFRRIPSETIASHLVEVATREGVSLPAPAADAIARRAEGSLRDALSLLDQAALLGGGTVGEGIVGQLIGAPEIDVLFQLADAVAVGDAREVFGIVHGLVQEGHDLRHFAGQATGHFRDLLLALSSPDDPAIVDVPPELHPRLSAQAGKFSAGELDRILALLLQAQTDLRWSTSPRLTLELALVRAAMPETDPQPAALVARLDRLERLAGLDPQGGQPPVAVEGPPPPPDALSADHRGGRQPRDGEDAPPTPSDALSADHRGGRQPREGAGATGAGATGEGSPPVGAPSASSVDAGMLRRSWPQVVEALKSRRKMQVYAVAQLATVGTYEEGALELVFPPGKEFAARKIEEKRGDLLPVLSELFGIAPVLRTTIRQGTVIEEPDLDEPPPTPEAAEELLKRQLGAEVVEES